LLSVDGQPIKQEADFYIHLLKIDPKHTLQLEYQRKGTRLSARIQPKMIPIPDGKELLGRKFGLTIRLLTDDEARQLDISGGLYITSVEKGSPADRAGVQRGMVVIQIDKYFPSDLEKVGAILEPVKRGDQVLFRFYAVQRQRIDVLGGYLVSR
jgi:serine protease Do